MKASVISYSEFKKDPNQLVDSPGNDLDLSNLGIVIKTMRRNFIIAALSLLERDEWIEAVAENSL